MKKSIRSLAILGVCALSLTACGKVSFADFQSKASEALKKDVPYTTAVLTGSIKASNSSSSSEQKVNSKFNVKGHVLTPASISDTAYAIIFTTFGLGTFSAAENTDYTYYAGSVFKVTYSFLCIYAFYCSACDGILRCYFYAKYAVICATYAKQKGLVLRY